MRFPTRYRDARARRALAAALGCVVAAVAVAVAAAGPSRQTAPRATSALPPGFRDTVVLSGLTKPTAIAFARDGRIFVAEQGGTIRVFDSLEDPAPKLFADLSTEVDGIWERGLLGLALAPRFPADP